MPRGRPRKEPIMTNTIVTSSDNIVEMKAGEKLLIQALRKYKCPREQLFISKDTNKENWNYYPDGGIFEVLNPKWDKKAKPPRKHSKYITINKPTVCFVTHGGAKRYYYEGYEDHESFKPLKDFQCDGISRKEEKSSYF